MWVSSLITDKYFEVLRTRINFPAMFLHDENSWLCSIFHLCWWYHENKSLQMRNEVTDYSCSVVGMFYFYTRKWNPIIMIYLLSCACHSHRHMNHYTLSMSWLYSFQQTSAVVLRKIVWNKNTSARLQKSKIPIKLNPFSVLVALWTLLC